MKCLVKDSEGRTLFLLDVNNSVPAREDIISFKGKYYLVLRHNWSCEFSSKAEMLNEARCRAEPDIEVREA
jgi:hypothetical protein